MTRREEGLTGEVEKLPAVIEWAVDDANRAIEAGEVDRCVAEVPFKEGSKPSGTAHRRR